MLSSRSVDLTKTLRFEVVLVDLMRTLPVFVDVEVLVDATEHVEYPFPCAVTQAAVGEAHTVRVPNAAPQRLLADAVVIMIVVEEAVEYHTPEGKVDVEGAGVVLADEEVEAGPAQVE